MKQCSKCREGKDESEFHKEKGYKDGLRNDCKKCNNRKSREYREVYREELNQKAREYHGDHREERNQKGREGYGDHREEINQKTKENNKFPLPHNSKLRQDLEKYEEVRKSKNGNTECKCAYDGDGFEPIKLQIKNRLDAINGEYSNGTENRLYCSEACKLSCSIYNKELYEKGYEPTTSREVQPALRKMVFARDDYICVECEGHKNNLAELGISLHCHHKEGVQQNPIESADTDMCETRCAVCHKKVHQIPGNTYNDLKCPPKSKYNTGEK